MRRYDLTAFEFCVLATSRGSAQTSWSKEAELVVDIDASILGRSPLRFADYNDAIAEEFAGVMFFARGRRRFLESMLAQPKIYRTPYFAERYEVSARKNIAAVLPKSKKSDRSSSR